LAAAGCGGGGQAPSAKSGGKTPDFALKDLSGKTVRLSDFKGKVVLIDFWATYCIPCADAIPEFQKLYETHRDKGFEIVGISIDPFTDNVPAFVKEHGVGYKIVLDSDAEAQDAFGIRGLPETFLVGRDGALREHWIGYDDELEAEIRNAVESALRAS
jgi:peroxiredoxin